MTALNPEISVVVPVYNEEENVPRLAREVLDALGALGRPFELVLVDDASTDKTWQRIQEAAVSDARIHGVKHQRNCGQSAALWTGFQHSSGSIIATLDGDLQNDPADLPGMIRQLNEVDFISGTRKNRADTWVRKASSRVARSARKAFLRIDVQDSGCAIRAFHRKVLGVVFPFNGLHRFLPILVASGGFNVRQVPVNHRPRIAGISKYGVGNRLWRGILDLFGVAWFQKRQLKPVEVSCTGMTSPNSRKEAMRESSATTPR